MTGGPSVPELVAARTWHGRDAEGVRNAFAYAVDYVLIDPEHTARGPWPFGSLVRVRAEDHGGAPGAGRGAAWLRAVLARALPGFAAGRVLLLAQPCILGHAFNPVSFWLVHDAGDVLRVVVAEVTNTYGDRHSYLCHTDDLAPIGPDVELSAAKAMHVSPFRPIAGTYRFRFDIRPDAVDIRIVHEAPDGRLVATLAGPRAPMTTRGLLRAIARRPFGTRRGLALIHWQALKLWRKGAPFRDRPEPPAHEVSR